MSVFTVWLEKNHPFFFRVMNLERLKEKEEEWLSEVMNKVVSRPVSVTELLQWKLAAHASGLNPSVDALSGQFLHSPLNLHLISIWKSRMLLLPLPRKGKFHEFSKTIVLFKLTHLDREFNTVSFVYLSHMGFRKKIYLEFKTCAL